ncbi:hypothetical protein Hanom_Chr09g00769451 [Helianthus anomalus]
MWRSRGGDSGGDLWMRGEERNGLWKKMGFFFFFFVRAQLSQVSFRVWSDYSSCMSRSDYNKRLGSFKRYETKKLISDSVRHETNKRLIRCKQTTP